jgi:hypothetical protein
MIEIRFDKTKDEVALLIWFLVDHSVYLFILSYTHILLLLFLLLSPIIRLCISIVHREIVFFFNYKTQILP